MNVVRLHITNAILYIYPSKRIFFFFFLNWLLMVAWTSNSFFLVTLYTKQNGALLHGPLCQLQGNLCPAPSSLALVLTRLFLTHFPHCHLVFLPFFSTFSHSCRHLACWAHGCSAAGPLEPAVSSMGPLRMGATPAVPHQNPVTRTPYRYVLVSLK